MFLPGDFFKRLEIKARMRLEEMHASGNGDSPEAEALKQAITESSQLYRMYNNPYGRDEIEFGQIRFRVLTFYTIGFGLAE